MVSIIGEDLAALNLAASIALWHRRKCENNEFSTFKVYTANIKRNNKNDDCFQTLKLTPLANKITYVIHELYVTNILN